MAQIPETGLDDDGETPPVATLKKSDLIDQIVGRTTLKKREAKAALDATLALLGEAVVRGDELILPPLGRLRVAKSKDLPNGAKAHVLKLRSLKDATQNMKTGLATDEDAD